MLLLKIAVSGKGGVGKTTIAGILARTLSRKGFKVLAIDADPNANLAVNLGMPLNHIEKITPVSENSALIEEKTGVKPASFGGVFRLSFHVDDIIDRFAVNTPDGVKLLVMGVVRTAGQGCMCPANALVRALLRHILLQRDEVIILDMEAGTEHFGRRTAENVDVMLIVSDANRKSLETAKKILSLSQEMGVKRGYIVGNKTLNSFEATVIKDYCDKNSIPLLSLVPYDEEIRTSDVTSNILNLSDSSFGVVAIQEIVNKLLA